jgi:CRP-like cAMP-binding protein
MPLTRIKRVPACDFFGEMSVLTNEPRSATVRCETAGELLRIGGVHVRALLARDAIAAAAVAAALSRYVQAHNLALADARPTALARPEGKES